MKTTTKALVNGGTGFLGLAVAQTLRDAGYETHVTALPEEASRFTKSPEGRGLTVHPANLADDHEVRRLFQEVGGPLGTLVSTVGGFTGGALSSVTVEDIDKLTTMNLKTAILVLREGYSYLKQNDGGAGVVLVAARGAVLGGPGSAVYSATKAAVANLALSAAQEWLEDGIDLPPIVVPQVMRHW